MSTPTTRLLVTAAAAVAASCGLFAQPDLASTSSEQQLRQQIAELQGETALARPAELIDPLRALAVLYHEAGDHALASAALEEARYVTRIHKGLASGDEALLLRQQIRSEKALGNDQRVWDLEQDMVTIARQNHDDIRMVPIFREMADDRFDALAEYRGGGFPPEIALGCYYTRGLRRYDDTRGEPGPPDLDCYSGQSAHVTENLADEFLMYYADAIEVLVKNGDYASRELRYLEKEAVRASPFSSFPGPGNALQKVGTTMVPHPNFLRRIVAARDCEKGSARPERLDQLLASEIIGGCLEPVVHTDGIVKANVGGWVSLVRLLAYEIRSGAPAAARANALANLADWHLTFSPADREIAIELYERAYRELEGGVGARASSMFSPEVPVTLGPNPFISAAKTGSSRHVDVSFDITRYGRSQQIEILETSKDATRKEERDLVRLIESTRFRPRYVDGRLADAAPVVVRYPLEP
jgi:hypothetical protein